MIVFWVCLILKSSTGSCCQISPLGLCSHLVPLCVCKCVGVWKREHVQSQVGQRTDFLVPCGDSKTFIFNFRDFLCGQNRKLHHLFLLLSNTFSFHWVITYLRQDKRRYKVGIFTSILGRCIVFTTISFSTQSWRCFYFMMMFLLIYILYWWFI